MGCIDWNSPGQNIGVGALSLPQGIFPPQVLNPGLPHCGQILYQLSHKQSPFLGTSGLSSSLHLKNNPKVCQEITDSDIG